MYKLFALFMLVVLSVSCFAADKAEKKPQPLSNLNDLAKIEKMMPFSDNATYGVLREKLSNAPVEKREAVLREFAKNTEWGTQDRFVSYYICAWYDVDYTRSRDYLTHVAFWWEWKVGPEMRDKDGDEYPFSFDDVSIDFLYALYEHNHDFKVLHDIITTQSDAGTQTAITGFTADAIGKHPRGVLHVAEISPKGWSFVYKLVHNKTEEWMDLGDTASVLKPYFKRVAADPKDPLASLAKDILKTKQKR